MKGSKVYSERTSLRTIIISLLTIILGLFLLLISNSLPFLQANPPFQSVIRDLGSLLVSTVTIAILWELAAKRAFLSELMTQVKIAEEIREAGLIRIFAEPQKVNWDEMFSRAKNLDIFFMYGSTWRSNNFRNLERLASSKGARIRVILPDPTNQKLMEELSARVHKTPERLKERIDEAANEFKKMFRKSDFSLWYSTESPLYSCYRFDKNFVLTIYHHGPIKHKEVPTFVVEEGGKIYNFLHQEFEFFLEEDNKIARKVFPTSYKS